MYNGLINKYHKYLAVEDDSKIITMNEGNTLFLKLKNLPKSIGLKNVNLYIKFEGLNPTGSFKDRGMTMAVTKANEAGSKAVICASTGNTSASAAAYAAVAGMKAYVLIPDKKIAMGKLAQAIVYGADVIAIEGNFDDALNMVIKLSQTENVTLVNSVNPFRLQGQKTAAFEICDDLGRAPDYLVLPVGNAGNISAYWMGFKEYYSNKVIDNLPKMTGFQAAGSAPIVENRIIENPETVATAIRIGNPASWKLATAARDESKGSIDKVTDEEILSAQRRLAAEDGIFAEPASCASIAGVIKMAEEGKLKTDKE
ncbi:MAG: threonine synthase, partial [Clostridia bacterium]|nr:threonine synthase [Clostridia bacterium]